MKITLVIMGVSGCGKTTIGNLLAQELSMPFFEGDDFHPESNIRKMKSGNKLSDEDRIPWLYRLIDVINNNNNEIGCVLACSALKQSYRSILDKNTMGKIHYIFLQGSYQLILKRLQTRKGHYMPETLLESQFEILEEPEVCLNISVDNKPRKIVQEIVRELTVRGYLNEEV